MLARRPAGCCSPRAWCGARHAVRNLFYSAQGVCLRHTTAEAAVQTQSASVDRAYVNTAASRLLGGVHNRPVACANMKWCVSAEPQESCSRSDQLSEASCMRSATPRVSGASSVESQKCSPPSSHIARLACIPASAIVAPLPTEAPTEGGGRAESRHHF